MGKGNYSFSKASGNFFSQIILSWKTPVFNRHFFRKFLGIGTGFLVKRRENFYSTWWRL